MFGADPPQYPPGYDPRTVETKANIKFNLGDVEGAQMAYQQALLDWVDDAREASSGDADPATPMGQAIADLWISFANLNRKANKLKSVSDTFETAVACEIAGKNGKLWLAFAKDQEARNRHKTAQKIFLRALVGKSDDNRPGADERYHPMLWNEFLRMMRELNNSPNLSLDGLRKAVEQEHVVQMKLEGSKEDQEQSESSGIDGPPLKRPKVKDSDSGELLMQHQPAKVAIGALANTLALSAELVEKETAAFANDMKQLPPDVLAAWYARDGDSPPSRPEPPLFTPSPPKASDATGRDVLGDELALQLIRRLLKGEDSNLSGSVLLEICRGCWMITALKEREASKALESIEKCMNRELEALDETLDSRASVAAPGALAAVQMINDNERNNFIATCNQRRRQLVDGYAWQFRHLLFVQQQILTKARLNAFDGPTVDASSIALQANVCAFMHSAFYLRARIGEKQHLAMLTSQEKRLEQVISSGQALPPPQRQVQSFQPTPAPLAYSQVQYHQQPPQQQYVAYPQMQPQQQQLYSSMMPIQAMQQAQQQGQYVYPHQQAPAQQMQQPQYRH